MEEVEAAETRMNTAKNALLSYIEARGPIDPEQHKLLVTKLKTAQAEFQQVVSELNN